MIAYFVRKVNSMNIYEGMKRQTINQVSKFSFQQAARDVTTDVKEQHHYQYEYQVISMLKKYRRTCSCSINVCLILVTLHFAQDISDQRMVCNATTGMITRKHSTQLSSRYLSETR